MLRLNIQQVLNLSGMDFLRFLFIQSGNFFIGVILE